MVKLFLPVMSLIIMKQEYSTRPTLKNSDGDALVILERNIGISHRFSFRVSFVQKHIWSS